LKTLSSIVVFLVLSLSAMAQVQPFVAGGGVLNGGGYVANGGALVTGVHFSGEHFLVDPEGGYETGGKNDDNDNTSSSGHTRYLKGDALVRFGKYYVGSGASWSKLYTPDYTKGSVHPRFTVGRDFNKYFDRVLVSYVQTGTDTSNGLQGIDAQAYWFFGSKHIFLRMDLNADFGHETVIPVSQGGSPQSVTAEKAQKIVSSSFQTVFGFRF
jgi:hypothetical protein